MRYKEMNQSMSQMQKCVVMSIVIKKNPLKETGDSPKFKKKMWDINSNYSTCASPQPFIFISSQNVGLRIAHRKLWIDFNVVRNLTTIKRNASLNRIKPSRSKFANKTMHREFLLTKSF